MLTEEQVRNRQNATPAGKLLLEMGWEYYDTESAARTVAEFAAKKISALEEKQSDAAVAYSNTITEMQKRLDAATAEAAKEREAHANCATDYGVLVEAIGGDVADHEGNLKKVADLKARKIKLPPLCESPVWNTAVLRCAEAIRAAGAQPA